MKALYLTLLVASLSAQASTLYKLKKPDGSIIYTDQPVPGAVPVDLSKTNSAVMPAYQGKLPARTSSTRTTTDAAIDYAIDIVNPAEQQAIRSNPGDLTVQVNIKPAFSGQLQLLMDNKVVKTQANREFLLNNVDRGEHHLQVQLIDNSGKVIASSPVRVFYLLRATILNRSQ